MGYALPMPTGTKTIKPTHRAIKAYYDNIEHAYYELTGEYEPFEGLCFVDTLNMAELAQGQFGFMTAENTARVQRQKHAPITVVIGNPPYNVGQLNENDNNKNRKYEVVDKRIRQTFAADSTATNKNALSDMYVKFFRWAIDRLGNRDGIVCFVSNNGFLDGIAFDGFRKHLAQEFQTIYHFDFKGNARTAGERRQREGGNIFHDQIRCGVGISVFVRKKKNARSNIYYHCVEDYWKAEEKQAYLCKSKSVTAVPWRVLEPDFRNTWLVAEHADQFANFIPVATKVARTAATTDVPAVFRLYGRGIETCRDDVLYDFHRAALFRRVEQFIEDYNGEVDRWRRASTDTKVDEFVRYDRIKWCSTLKQHLQRGTYAKFASDRVRPALYRPFLKRYLYYDSVLIHRPSLFARVSPTPGAEQDNRVVVVSDLGYRADSFTTLVTDLIPDLHLCAACDAHQCFPFYIYDEDGGNRRENITDWALAQFRAQYGEATAANGKKARGKRGAGGPAAIEKWDIFYYAYGLLHHPGYRTKYADNLKRELPRIPFAPDFWAFSKAGRELAKGHLDYEEVEPYPLTFEVAKDRPLSYRVEDKMRLSKDKTALTVNPSLTLSGIPPQALEYRLGNRSALEWVIDQYQVKHDPKGQTTSDPNRPDDPEYIVRLVGQVIQVSLETTRIVNALPDDFGG